MYTSPDGPVLSSRPTSLRSPAPRVDGGPVHAPIRRFRATARRTARSSSECPGTSTNDRTTSSAGRAFRHDGARRSDRLPHSSPTTSLPHALPIVGSSGRSRCPPLARFNDARCGPRDRASLRPPERGDPVARPTDSYARPWLHAIRFLLLTTGRGRKGGGGATWWGSPRRRCRLAAATRRSPRGIRQSGWSSRHGSARIARH